MSDFDVVTIDRTARNRIREVWTGLEAASRPTYFLSWGWVETWLDALPPSVAVKLYVVRRGGAPVAAFFLGAHREWRHRVVPSRGLHLNMTGLPEYDEICIEYNGWLHDGSAPKFTEVVHRLPDRWDELHLPALDADLGLVGEDPGSLRVRIERQVPSPLVDLDKVRAAGDYLKLLSGNTRSQIRRSIKLYGARGKVTLERAETVDQALAIFDELVVLHRRTWTDRDKSGAFLPFVHGFHQRLIRNRFDAGEIQLLRIRAGDDTIGCLYNLVSRGNVLFYQSGLAYDDDRRIKPGLVCHAEAVRHLVPLGHRYYDFLGGNTRYKHSLSTDARALVWVRLQRRHLRFFAEDAARYARDRYRAYRTARAALPGPPQPAASDGDEA